MKEDATAYVAEGTTIPSAIAAHYERTGHSVWIVGNLMILQVEGNTATVCVRAGEIFKVPANLLRFAPSA